MSASSDPAAAAADARSDDEEEDLPALQSIWQDDHVQKSDDGKSWTCEWCAGVFTPVHASRAKAHVCKVARGGIRPCKAVIPEKRAQRYQDLLDRDESRKTASSNTIMRQATATAKRQAEASSALQTKRARCKGRGGGLFSTPVIGDPAGASLRPGRLLPLA